MVNPYQMSLLYSPDGFRGQVHTGCPIGERGPVALERLRSLAMRKVWEVIRRSRRWPPARDRDLAQGLFGLTAFEFVSDRFQLAMLKNLYLGIQSNIQADLSK